MLDERYRDASAGRFLGQEVRYYHRNVRGPAEFIPQISDADVLGLARAFPFPFDRQLIEQLPHVQFIHKPGSGTDWFDLAALNEHGILLAVNSGFNAASVAEHTVTLMLLTLRNIFWHADNLRRGIWRQDMPPMETMLLEGKTVGIVGIGQIGARVAKAVLGLGAHVVAHQRHPRPEIAILAGVRWVSFEELLRESDLVSLHLPLTTTSEKMIGRQELAMMKPTAVLINTSRGRLVDERALYEALAEGRLRGAGLDVFDREPLPRESPLIKLPNVIATPHVAGTATEIASRQVEGTLMNIERFVSGLVPLRLVNPDLLARRRGRAHHLYEVYEGERSMDMVV